MKQLIHRFAFRSSPAMMLCLILLMVLAGSGLSVSSSSGGSGYAGATPAAALNMPTTEGVRHSSEQGFDELLKQMAALKQEIMRSGETPGLMDQYKKIIEQMSAFDSRTAKPGTGGDIRTLAPEATLCISNSLAGTDNTYQRPNPPPTLTCPGNTPTVRFDNFGFNLTGCTTSNVTITLCGGAGCTGLTGQNIDTLIYVYRTGGATAGTGAVTPFNKGEPCVNLVGASDDGPGCGSGNDALRSGLTITLGPGHFVVVVAAFSGTLQNTGNYNLFVDAPGCTLAGEPTAVNLNSFSATEYIDAVQLDWQTGLEVDNLGFNLYRDQKGKRTRLTPQMVAGSALLAGPGTVLGAGQSYSWFDSPSQSKGAQYWLEEIDLNGQSTWHGPVAVTDSGNKDISPPKRGRNTLISTLGTGGGQAFSSPVESRATLPEITQGRMQMQSNIASQKGVKLSVKQEGLYRVSQPDLARAGFDTNVNPRMLQLYVDGQQVPLAEVNTAGGRFDSSSAIEFYGQGIDSAVTDSRTYWLVAGKEPGLRILQAAGKGKAGKSNASSFPYTVERKDRTIYFSALRNGEKENFFGAVIARNPVEQSLSLQHLDASASEAFLEVALQGVSLVPHRVQVQINGARAGEVSFNGQAQGAARFSIPQALLKEGENLVTLIPQGEQADICLVDSVSITYQRGFTADNDALKFTTGGKKSVTIDGFSNADVRVFDITDPNNVQEVLGKVKQRGAGYSVSISALGNTKSTMLALANGRINSPSAIAAGGGSNLRQELPGADFVIITRRDLIDSLSPLVALRQRQGLSVAVVDVIDIYDSFSFGQKTPQAIKDFLVFAKASYKTAPRYVLIAGDASLDSKNYLGLGDGDIVPTKLIDTQLMETASDDWFVESTGMAIGRLPVSTAEEASIVVAKLISYDQSSPSQEMLLVSDSDDAFNFDGATEQLRGLIPSNLRVERIDRGKDGDAIARTRLLNALFRGQKIVNYIGHGSVDQWKSNLLTGADIGELRNTGGLPVFVMMTCLNGYFQDPSLDSLAESLMKAPKGAIAIWASSGMTSPDVQSPANQELYRWLFDKNNPSIMLGDAVSRAKAAGGNMDVRHTWILFGDPTMRLR